MLITAHGKNYIALVKRSADARHNPNLHTGFFGWIDSMAERRNPILGGSRELAEEIIVADKKLGQIYGFYTPKGLPAYKLEVIAKENQKLWAEEKNVNLPRKIKIVRPRVIKTLEYIEDIGRIKRLVVCASITTPLKDLYFLDSETRSDEPRCGLLDRRIDIFDLLRFKKWWLYAPIGTVIEAERSFTTGKLMKTRGLITKDKNNISPSFMLALNKWWDV